MDIPVIEFRIDGRPLDASSMRSATLHREESRWGATIICDRSSDLYARCVDVSTPQETEVLILTPAGHYSGCARFVVREETEGAGAEVGVRGSGELEPRPRAETQATGRAWLVGARSVRVSALEVDSRPLGPSSLRTASLIHNEHQWLLEIECDWESDLADDIRRNGMLRGVDILATSESCVYSGKAWFGFQGEITAGTVVVAAYGLGRPRAISA